MTVTRTERDAFTLEGDTAAEAIDRVKRQTEHLWRGAQDVRYWAVQIGDTVTVGVRDAPRPPPATR